MSSLVEPSIFIAVLVVVYALTGLLQRNAGRLQLIDVPNERSSHEKPTPRGGGVAIVLACALGMPLLAWCDLLSLRTTIGLLAGGLLVAMIGFMDDRGHVSIRWRLSAHFAAAGWVLAWSDGVPPLHIYGQVVDLGSVGLILAGLYIVWVLNLYNFMDGIDGIASVEAITVCFGGALLYWMEAPQSKSWSAPLLVAFAVLGFLFWNFPRAKVFLGDTGSGFLGFALAALSIVAAREVSAFLWSWIILLGVFIVDATVTLFRRAYRREKLYGPHRSHAYQYASRVHRSHVLVTTGIGFINLIWLLPLALLVGAGVLEGVEGICVAFAPLVWLAYRYRAGARELQT